MGIVAVKIKLMPTSPDTNLETMEAEAKKTIEKNQGETPKFEKEPIAFGLNALFVIFAWPEEKELEGLENQLKKIKNVNSVQVIDIRKALG